MRGKVLKKLGVQIKTFKGNLLIFSNSVNAIWSNSKEQP
jgi:hypothetical protein